MNFDGAVLVDNKRIQNACDNYKVMDKERDSYINNYITTLTKEFEDLSWWQKFWYEDCPVWGLEKFQYVLKKKYGVGYRSNWTKDTLRGLYQGGVISEEDYDKLNFGYYHNIMVDLMTMVRCGEPVYLNPQQARFVNKFYEDEK